ncbi:amino acid/amide ABC transporter substrate-binding protein (HAAT family) [Tumebacillus permanentifrigoris]|uniref:Amino acid/amide ABC transporter substrate-binding protein (HAAT family) n=2 Tax=Tumebacillus permanentifrigoris TaxID=378543 RepID=A0A316D6B4_9BACL|nr:amino acid/amide ABC transporter substrate-binding protein (HAAT family) [Tumebacillus permanentifrigoris]
MMMGKKFIAVTAALTLTTVGLAGCSKSTSSEGGSGDTIKVGTNLELTGAVAAFGQSQLNGINLAVEEINKAGGINGKKLEVISADNASKKEESTRTATKLITQDKVDVLLGAAISGDTFAAVEVANNKKVPMLTPSATNDSITFDAKKSKLNEYVFRACFIDSFQGKVMADFSAKNLKAKNAVVYIDNSSDYSKGLAKSFTSTFTAGGGKVVAEESYQTKDTDFKAVLTRIKTLNPEVIFVPGYYEEVGKIIKQAREMGIKVPMMGGDGWDAPELAQIAGAENLNNTFISNHYSSEDKDPKVVKFIDNFKSKYNSVPDAMAVLGYDGMYMMADAIKRAGSTDKEKIKDALANTKDFEGVTGKIALDKNHDPVKAAVVLEYKDGKQTFNTKVQP